MVRGFEIAVLSWRMNSNQRNSDENSTNFIDSCQTSRRLRARPWQLNTQKNPSLRSTRPTPRTVFCLPFLVLRNPLATLWPKPRLNRGGRHGTSSKEPPPNCSPEAEPPNVFGRFPPRMAWTLLPTSQKAVPGLRACRLAGVCGLAHAVPALSRSNVGVS